MLTISAPTTNSNTATSATAKITISDAFDRLKGLVPAGQSQEFNSTDLEDVWAAVREIERQLKAKQKSSNMKRLEPLFKGLDHYSKAIDVLCNGTDYVPWIWAPIKLILQIAADYIDAFRIIIDAYAQIAETLPRTDVYSHVLKSHPGFQECLAVLYADILQFHQEAYILINRSSWRIFFSTAWGRFRCRFEGIIEDMKRHSALVDKTANAYNIQEASIDRQKAGEERTKAEAERKKMELERAEAEAERAEAQQWRDQNLQQITRQQKHESVAQFQAIMSWLEVGTSLAEQEEIRDDLCSTVGQYQHTCDWIFESPKISTWFRNDSEESYLWVKGKPGAGKSVLTAKIIETLSTEPQTNLMTGPSFSPQAGQLSRPLMGTSVVIYHFCSHLYQSSKKYGNVLRLLIAQILRPNDDLLAYVYEEYLLARKSTSSRILEDLLVTLVPALGNGSKPIHVRVVVDGLDECDEAVQQSVLKLLDRIGAACAESSRNKIGGSVITTKVLVSSQDSPKLSKMLRRKRSVSLYEDSKGLTTAIATYTRQRLLEMRDDVFSASTTDNDVEDIVTVITSNADGMFLWARLVLDVIESGIFFDSAAIRVSAISNVPKDLEVFYRRILDRIIVRFHGLGQEQMHAVWGWIACAQRPLKKFELLSALLSGSSQSASAQPMTKNIFEFFKPLVEERKDSTLSFVHISVKNYLQSPSSGPFIRQPQVQYEQAIACVTCLLWGAEAFHENSPRYHTRYERVVQGFHGLHLYASEYWVEHILIAAGLHGSGLDASPPLLERITALCNISSTRAPTPSDRPGDTSQSKPDNRVQALERHPQIHDYVIRELVWRKQIRVKHQSQQKNPSPISETTKSFQLILRHLLPLHDFPGTSSEGFKQFTEDYNTSAYTCSFPGCVRATLGFGDDRSKTDHEQAHTQMLRCTVSDCTYDLPLRNTAALKQHIVRYHTPPWRRAGPLETWNQNLQITPTPRLAPTVNRSALDLQQGYQQTSPLQQTQLKLTQQQHQDPSQNNMFMDAGGNDYQTIGFADPTQINDILDGFDFDSFLHDGYGGDDGVGFDFGNVAFDISDGSNTIDVSEYSI